MNDWKETAMYQLELLRQKNKEKEDLKTQLSDQRGSKGVWMIATIFAIAVDLILVGLLIYVSNHPVK